MAKKKETAESVEQLTPQQKAAKTKAANKAKKEETETIIKPEEVKVGAIAEDIKEDITEPKKEEEVTNPPEPTVEIESEKAIKPEIKVIAPLDEEGEREDLAEYFPADGSPKTLISLKLHSEYEYLYVGKFGGLFDPKTFTESMDEKAILYKNPYFKK